MRLVSGQADEVRPELLAAFERCWDELSRAGTWWDAADKLAIAEIARAAVVAAPTPAAGERLHPAAAEATTRVAASPAAIDEAWVGSVSEAIGEPNFVELVGIAARVVAADTFARLLGNDVTPLPDPRPGEPSREPPPEGMRRNHTWVAMAMPVPPFVLGQVPAAMAAMNDLTDQLYMPMDQMGDPDWRRGDLHRTQIELVAASVSHENECFY